MGWIYGILYTLHAAFLYIVALIHGEILKTLIGNNHQLRTFHNFKLTPVIGKKAIEFYICRKNKRLQRRGKLNLLFSTLVSAT